MPSPVGTGTLPGKVALVTGASNGIGAAVARRLADLGASLVLADVDDDRGKALADELGAAYVHCDVSDLAANKAAVSAAQTAHGRLDLVFLNAGIASGCGVGDDFDPERYRRAMGVNLDGVVYGTVAALPALKAAGGGTIVATASMAGIAGIPGDPIYAANKHAVVGFVRSLAQEVAPQGIKVQALCPSFTDTAILGEGKAVLERIGFPVLEVGQVVDTFTTLLDSEGTGECWFVIPGRESRPFTFRRAPGPRV
ncbi:SDR family oxidoreductase [Bailinhaonella thermotolerans]|uniref:SDR family oxidoreductase n=1 Tax=Bailinhaonella thermotolerans TaxID=1070861 RepID=A0A3A4ATC1_9ACTN|nr:SDR family oxidoreductase [Bailinhaonella thermotolerans]